MIDFNRQEVKWTCKGHEKFADLLSFTVINLREAGCSEELSNGTLYTTLHKKIPEEKLTQYQQESVENLRIWVIQEAEFKTVAAEMIHGLKVQGNKYHRKKSDTLPIGRLEESQLFIVLHVGKDI